MRKNDKFEFRQLVNFFFVFSLTLVIASCSEGNNKQSDNDNGAKSVTYNINSSNNDIYSSSKSKAKSFSFFSIDINNELYRHVTIKRNLTNKGIKEFKKEIKENPLIFNEHPVFASKEEYFAINAAMYTDDQLPPGLTINKRKVLKPINTQKGAGNFFEPGPNGILLIDSASVEILETAKYNSNQTPYFALQSGPMLIINGVINPNLNQASTNFQIRSAVGIVDSGASKKLVFVSSNSEVSFFELASYLYEKFNCVDAIHLESINAFIDFPGSTYRIKNQVVKNFILIR